MKIVDNKFWKSFAVIKTKQSHQLQMKFMKKIIVIVI